MAQGLGFYFPGFRGWGLWAWGLWAWELSLVGSSDEVVCSLIPTVDDITPALPIKRNIPDFP